MKSKSCVLVASVALLALLLPTPPTNGQPNAVVQASVAPSGQGIFFLFKDDAGNNLNVASLSDQREVHGLVLAPNANGNPFTLTLRGQTTPPIPKTFGAPLVYGQWDITLAAPGVVDLAISLPTPAFFFSDAAVYEVFDGDPSVVASFRGSATVNLKTGTGPSSSFTDGSLNRGGNPISWMPLGRFTFSGTQVHVRASGPDPKVHPGDSDVLTYISGLRIAPLGGGVTFANAGQTTNHSDTDPMFLEKSSQPYDFPGPPACQNYCMGAGGHYTLDPTATQLALQGLSTIGFGNVSCSGFGTVSSPLKVAYVGTFGNSSVPLISSSDSGVVVARLAAGDAWPYIKINNGQPIKLSNPYWGTGLGDRNNPTARTNNPYLPWVYFALVQSAPAVQWEDNRAHNNSVDNGGGKTWAPSSAQGFSGFVYQTMGIGASATWRRDGQPAGTYQISATWPVVANASNDIIYTVANRQGSVLAHFHADQTVAPPDGQLAGVQRKILGSVTLSGFVDDIVVTASNNTSNVMVADAIAFERTSPDTGINISGSDSVTYSAGVGWALCGVPSNGSVAVVASAPQANVGTQVANLVGESLYQPVPATSKTMVVGYNINNCFNFIPVQPFANRMASYQEPPQVLARDVDGYPTKFNGNPFAQVSNLPFSVSQPPPDVQGNGKGWPNISSGKFTVLWDGASDVGVDGTEDLSRANFTGTTGNRRVFNVPDQPGWYSPNIIARIYSTSQNVDKTFNADVRNLRIYPSDLSSDPPSKFTSGFTSKIQSTRSLRFLDPLQALAGNGTNIEDYDPPQSRITKYGNPKIVTTPVASVAAGTSGFFNPNNGCVVRVTTKVPHQIGEGFFVTFPSPGMGTVTFSNGVTAPLINYGTGGNAHIISSTVFEYQIGLVATITSGAGDVGGSVTFSQGTYFPMSDMIAICNLENRGDGGDFYINTSHTATDSCLFQMGVLVGTKLKVGKKARVEISNEVWNYAFYSTHYLDAASYGNNIGSRSGVTPYYVYLANRQWNQFQNGMASVGRANDMVRVFGSQWSNASVTDSVAAEAQRQGVAFDEISLAPYIDCQASPNSGAGLEPSMGPLVDLMVPAQYLDLMEGFHFYTGYQSINPAHKAALVAHGYPNVKIIAYEGGPSGAIPYPEQGTRNPSRTGEKSHAVHRHPRYLHFLLAKWQQEMETGMSGPYHIYQLAGTGDQVIGGQFAMWTAYIGIDQLPGTGDPVRDATNITSPDRADLVKSEVGGAVDTWMSMFSGGSTPVVVPPIPHHPKVVPPSRGRSFDRRR